MSPTSRVLPWVQRFNLKLLILVLAIELGVNLIGVGHLLLALRNLLSPADLRVLLQVSGLLLLVLIPAAGIYSLVSEFAFWEGWLDGLPAPAHLFPSAGTEPSSAQLTGDRCYLVYLDGIQQLERDHPPRVSAFLEVLEQHHQSQELRD